MLRSQVQAAGERLARYQELIAHYAKHGRATVLAFGYSTPLFRTQAPSLSQTVQAVIDDLMNTHQRSVRQKLEGGQLKVYIEELRFPWLMYAAETVGLFAPEQLDQAMRRAPVPVISQLRDAVSSMLILTLLFG